MKSKGLFKSIGLVLIGSLITISSLNAQDEAEAAEKETKTKVVGDVNKGKNYFEGSEGFMNGGPACITCHNVTNDKLIPGGLLAADLTEVYPKYDAALAGWLDNPGFRIMESAYENNKLEESERIHLAAFLKYANEVKDEQKANSGMDLFLIGGIGGLGAILVLISLLWMKRKKQMVKKDIFSRQSRAWDARH